MKTETTHLKHYLITTKVKASFAADPQVSALAISVDTEHGVVTLSGVVESESERQRCRLYDTPHEFNPQMQAEAWEWLDRWVNA